MTITIREAATIASTIAGLLFASLDTAIAEAAAMAATVTT